ncbi:MAG TPA: phosphate/phosphite/phosphonate ABC transporter substrate-binding protein [Acidimicrobiia bacterium]|nr:phosphate/phosphite/phosphonate ABC transporter substrate-binding protein [Acidimicrobiia bacterium]
MKFTKVLVLLLVLGLIAAACAGEDTTTTTTEATTTTTAATTTTATPTTTEAPMAEVGSAENPIKVLFVPSVEAEVIVTGGDIMKAALEEATGLKFEVTIPTSYAATIEEMCASPDNTMGFIPGLGYVLASNRCGVDVSFKAVRFGWSVYWAQILVPRDSDIETIADLEGKTWAYPDTGSTSGYMVPTLMFDEAGVTPGDEVESGGHPQAALAVYRGEADFATTFFSPPLTPNFDWAVGDDPEIPDDIVDSCAPSEDGSKLLCGPEDAQWRVLDARASARTDAPDIIQEVKILAISPEIPNDTLSFGPEFPADVRAQIEDALVAFAAECDTNEDCTWNQSIGNQDFYGWTGIDPATDSEYDSLRRIVELVGYELEG